MIQRHSADRVSSTQLRSANERPVAALLLMALLAAATLGMAVLTNGNIAGALAPVFGFLFIYAVVKMPLRYLWLVYIALVMTLDSPTEPFASGHYYSPFHPVAVALSAQLKLVVPISALVVSGLDLLIMGTLLLHVVRRIQESPLDREGYVAMPLPLVIAAWLCLGGVVFATVWGLATGGAFRFALWQIQRNIYLPIVLLLGHAIFPGPAQLKPYMRLLIVVACIRSVIAIMLRFDYPEAEYTTSHADSMLFATVTCYQLLRLLHGTSRREKAVIFPTMALIGWGMVANDRRLVWVEIGIALVFVYFMSPWTLLKRRFAQITIGSIPVLAAYIAVGWGSGSGIFKPVATLRSMVDSKSDGSTLWRDLENFNLVTTFTQNPVIGSGFGHPFIMAVAMPDITEAYELEPYVPHNSIVGLFAYTGYVGFALIWLVPLVGAFVSARAYYRSQSATDRTMALTCFCAVVIYGLQCYGDMGLGSITAVLLLGPLFAMVGKQAVLVGAWPRAGRPKTDESAGLTHASLARTRAEQ